MNKVMTTLLTGASGGIGLEMCRLLAARGHRLVLASRSAQKLEDVAGGLRRDYGVEVHICGIDLSAPGAAERLLEFTQAKKLSIDALVNNAGFGMIDEHVDTDPEALRQMLQLNIVTVAELCRLYGAHMKRRRSGMILNVASAAAFQPTPYFAAYGASKSFVLNFSEALAKELEDYGVSVSCLSPGPTDTVFFDSVDQHRIAGTHHFGMARRADARVVAEAGVELMLRGGLSRVVGFGNQAMIFTNRLAPRALVAAVSKRLLRPLDVGEGRN
jgi:short-subunit dehydrogenase